MADLNPEKDLRPKRIIGEVNLDYVIRPMCLCYSAQLHDKIMYCKNMRIAVCMRGAIAKKNQFSKINSLYSDGDYVDYKKCYRSIVKHLKPSHQYDFFLQSWNPELEKELVALYKPVASSFEDNTRYNDEISSLCVKEDDFGGISQALAIKKSIMLKEAYEKKHKITYDLVILYRYDVLLWKNINIEKYDREKIYVNAHDNSNGDFHFIMNKENANQFKYLYDSIKIGNRHIQHYWIKHYVEKYMKKKLYMDDIIPGIHQEVIRKIDNHTRKGLRFSKKNKSTKKVKSR